MQCPNCNGTGIYNGSPCPYCLNGQITATLQVTEIYAKQIAEKADKLPKAVKPIYTYQILEVTDSDEYTALDANKKAWYNLFISAGVLDMSDGTKARDLFLAWLFPPGKKTYAALMAIL